MKAIFPLPAMMVNLPCLVGSCPNFLRTTCSYTECRLSSLTGSLPQGKQPATALVCDWNITDPPSASVGADNISGRCASIVQRQVCIPAERLTPHDWYSLKRAGIRLCRSLHRFRVNDIYQHLIRIEMVAFL